MFYGVMGKVLKKEIRFTNIDLHLLFFCIFFQIDHVITCVIILKSCIWKILNPTKVLKCLEKAQLCGLITKQAETQSLVYPRDWLTVW